MAAIDQIAEKWDLNAAQLAILRSSDESSAGSITMQLWQIDKLLFELFPQRPQLRAAWPLTPNKAFEGVKPIDVVLSDGCEGALRVRKYLLSCALK